MFKLKPFLNLLVITCLPLSFFAFHNGGEKGEPVPVTAAFHSLSKYCNARFDFCVSYPSDLLPQREESANDDGVILETYNGAAKATVFGSYNVTQWTPEELFESMLNSATDGKGGAKILTTIFGFDYYEAYFISGAHIYFSRSFFVDDYYISLMIKVPVDEPILMEQLREEVVVDFGKGG